MGEPEFDRHKQTLKILSFTQIIAICCVFLNSLEHYMSTLEGSPLQRGSYPLGVAITTYLLAWILKTTKIKESWELLAYCQANIKEHAIFITNFSVIFVMSEESIFLSSSTYKFAPM